MNTSSQNSSNDASCEDRDITTNETPPTPSEQRQRRVSFEEDWSEENEPEDAGTETPSVSSERQRARVSFEEEEDCEEKESCSEEKESEDAGKGKEAPPVPSERQHTHVSFEEEDCSEEKVSCSEEKEPEDAGKETPPVRSEKHVSFEDDCSEEKESEDAGKEALEGGDENRVQLEEISSAEAQNEDGAPAGESASSDEESGLSRIRLPDLTVSMLLRAAGSNPEPPAEEGEVPLLTAYDHKIPQPGTQYFHHPDAGAAHSISIVVACYNEEQEELHRTLCSFSRQRSPKVTIASTPRVYKHRIGKLLFFFVRCVYLRICFFYVLILKLAFVVLIFDGIERMSRSMKQYICAMFNSIDLTNLLFFEADRILQSLKNSENGEGT